MADRIPPETSRIPPEASRITTEPVAGGPGEPSLTSLVAGIVGDVQKLIRQEIQLARTEVHKEWDKTKVAAGSVAAGAAVLALSSVLFCFAFVYLFATYLTWIPLWGWFAIVAGLLAAAGGGLIALGRSKAAEINVVPPQTAETMRENVEWLKNQT